MEQNSNYVYTLKQSSQFKKDLKLAVKRGLKIEKLRDIVNSLAGQETLDE